MRCVIAAAFLAWLVLAGTPAASACPDRLKIDGRCPPSTSDPMDSARPAAPAAPAPAPAAAAAGSTRSYRIQETAAPDAPLTPARAFLKATDIPPAGFGAYGVVSFAALPTTDTRPRLMMICEAFKAHFPRNVDVPQSVPIGDRMLTVWPVRDPERLRTDDCAVALAQYDLFAAQSAIADAKRQGGQLNGPGPYLIGWSPSHSRGQPDRLVLVVNLSELNTQARINEAFRFWRQRIVDDPELWRRGFSLERLKLSLRDFADRYGEDLTEVIELTTRPGGK